MRFPFRQFPNHTFFLFQIRLAMLDSGYGLDLIRKDVSVSSASPPLLVLPCYRIWVDVLVWFTPWYGLVLSVWALSVLLWSLLLSMKLRQCPIRQLKNCLALGGDKSPLSDHWRAFSHFHLICDTYSEGSSPLKKYPWLCPCLFGDMYRFLMSGQEHAILLCLPFKNLPGVIF